MIRKLLVSILPFTALVFFTSSQMDDNGRAGKTNSPGETNCATSCHDSYTLNSGPGSITIQSPGMPFFEYTPGQTYNMSVTVAHAGVGLFGVGIECLIPSGDNAGMLNISDVASTQIKNATISGISRRNVTHTLNGGLSADSKVFNFNWTAPPTGTGNVTFYFSGVAANGNGNNSLDYVYNSSQVFTEYCPVLSQPGSISGDTIVCSASSVNYSIVPVPGATSYTWTIPVGWTGTSTTESISVVAGSSYGIMSVTADNVCGASAASTLSIIVNTLPAPAVSLISSTTDSLFSTPASTYQWFLDGDTITGATDFFYLPSQVGNYSVIVTDSNGCSGTSPSFAYTSLGIKEKQSPDNVSIFLNAVTNSLNVHVDRDFNEELLLLDFSGKVVLKYQLNNSNNKIDLNGIADGNYFVIVGSGADRVVTRIVKIR